MDEGGFMKVVWCCLLLLLSEFVEVVLLYCLCLDVCGVV